MLEQATKVKCPLCAGQGELSPWAIVAQFTNPALRKRLEARVAEVAATFAPVGIGAKNNVLNFEKESHNWNPAVSVWRRSPKE